MMESALPLLPPPPPPVWGDGLVPQKWLHSGGGGGGAVQCYRPQLVLDTAAMCGGRGIGVVRLCVSNPSRHAKHREISRGGLGVGGGRSGDRTRVVFACAVMRLLYDADPANLNRANVADRQQKNTPSTYNKNMTKKKRKRKEKRNQTNRVRRTEPRFYQTQKKLRSTKRKELHYCSITRM